MLSGAPHSCASIVTKIFSMTQDLSVTPASFYFNQTLSIGKGISKMKLVPLPSALSTRMFP